VWALIDQANVYRASSARHRYQLVNAFIARMDEWWLVGTQSTAHWGPGMSDVANSYVLVGVSGGLFTLLAYLFLLRCGFKSLGAAIRLSGNNKERAFLWSLGASLMAHMVGFFGLSYYDQMVFIFALFLGLISAASSAVLSRQWAAQRERVSRMLLAHTAATNCSPSNARIQV
jgi:hypothetical protein